MSYYDDFGVSQAATPDEIRDSYHALVRLLHPDHADSALKSAAEAQMRRVNERYAILSDPERRRRYDQELAGLTERPLPIIIQAPRPMPQVRRRLPVGSLAWGGAVLASGGLIVWLSAHDAPPGGVPPTTSVAASETPGEQSSPEQPTNELVASLRHQLKVAMAQRDEAVAQLTRLREQPSGKQQPAPKRAAPVVTEPEPAPVLSASSARSAAPAPETTEAVNEPVVSTPAPPPAPVRKRVFHGMWFYAKPRTENKNPAIYPPEFIETTIVEENGSLHGRYRARYRVTDRPISPDVNFEFDGKISGRSADLAWKGDGGSHGEAHLKLITDTSMEMKWSATERGSLGLSAGTAVLTRGPE